MWQGPPYRNGGGLQYPQSQQNQAGQGVNNSGGTPISRGVAIGLLGGILAAVGDTLGVIGAAIAIEEARIDSIRQDQQNQQFQQQLDDLKQQLAEQQDQQKSGRWSRCKSRSMNWHRSSTGSLRRTSSGSMQ